MTMRPLVAAVLLVCVATVDAERVAVSDFRVHSRNPRYEFMGKGISEMLAVELRKSKGLELVERERRTELLREMEIALSDLADRDAQVRVGKLLTADYIVFGEIVDLDGELLISLRMARVETGEIAWSEKLVARVSNYDFITGYFTSAILGHLGIRVAQATVEKAEAKVDKNEEAVVALSKAMERLDSKDEDGARKELTRAARFDPHGEAARYYLSKLSVNTTKFKVMTEPYFSYGNPAYLGIMRTDMLNFSGALPVDPFMPPSYENCHIAFSEDKALTEVEGDIRAGYAFPVGERFGLRVELVDYVRMERYWRPAEKWVDAPESGRQAPGVILGLGYSPSDPISVGLSVGVYSSTANADHLQPFGTWIAIFYDKPTGATTVFSADVGFLHRTQDERLILDTRLGFSSETYDVVDPESLTVEAETSVPVYWENTVVLSFNKRRSFFTVKQMNDVCFDRMYYYGRILPAIEHFYSHWLSARVGMEASFAQLNDSSLFGYGAIGGATLRIMRWHCDVDLNLTYRLRPSSVVEELLYPECIWLLGVSFYDLWRARE